MTARSTVLRLLTLALGLTVLVPPAAASAQSDTSANGALAFHAYVNGEYDVFVQQPGSSERVNVTAGVDGWSTSPDWSPDGTRIAFTGTATSMQEVYVIDADGSDLRQLTTQADPEAYEENWGPRWSPDGTRISYTHDYGNGDSDIFLMDPDGSDKVNVTDPWETLGYADYGASWSPDGSRLIFGGARPGNLGGTYDIVTADPDGSDQQRLIGNHDHALWPHYPSFSPDGTKVVYMQSPNSGNDWDIWVMDADGTDQQNLTQHPAGDDYPTWSADGSQIFFTSNRSTGWQTDLWVLDYPGTAEPAARTASRGTTASIASTTAGTSSVPTASRVLGNVSAPDFAGTTEAVPPLPPADRAAKLADGGVGPAVLRTKPGLLVRWTNVGTTAHGARETTLRLFRSEPVPVGGAYDHRFAGAGTYGVVDPTTTTGSKQTVEVVLQAAVRDRRIRATWGSEPLTGSHVHDVQVRLPGTTGFRAWTTTTSPSGAYVAPKAGTYDLRARVRDTASGLRSGWSPVRTVSVTG